MPLEGDVSIFLCGVADGRHVLATIVDAAGQLCDQPGLPQLASLKLTLNDIKAASLARVSLVLTVLRELGDVLARGGDGAEHCVCAYYLYFGAYLPPTVDAKIRTILRELSAQVAPPPWLASTDAETWRRVRKVYTAWERMPADASRFDGLVVSDPSGMLRYNMGPLAGFEYART